MKKVTNKKNSRVTFDDVMLGEVIYMYGDHDKCFVVDTLLEGTIIMHEKGHDPIVGRVCLVRSEFEGRWLREMRSYMNFAVKEDDPIPKMSEEQFSKVVLKRIKQVAKMSFGSSVLEEMDLRSIRDHMTDSIIFALRTSVMAETLSDREKEVVFEYPSSWWQWLKKDKFPQWFLKRFPVQYTKTSEKVRFEEIALYPNLALAMPDQAGEVYFQSLWHENYRETEDMKKDFVTVTVK